MIANVHIYIYKILVSIFIKIISHYITISSNFFKHFKFDELATKIKRIYVYHRLRKIQAINKYTDINIQHSVLK